MEMSGISQKRAILLSTKTRFTPELQPVRETAIDKIVEQNLMLLDCPGGVSLQEMEEQGATCFIGGFPTINHLDMNKSLSRLSGNRVKVLGEKGKEKYRLSEPALKELWETQRLAEGRFTRVVERLFRNTKVGATTYSAPFLDCLCHVFSRLSETYVRLLKKEIDADELLSSPSLQHALKEIETTYPNINPKLFKTAVFTFFRDSDTDFDAIKWNMAQNYYVAQALGMDPSGKLLSSEVFGNALLYLDTNVVIPALESKAQHHGSFRILSEACNHLGIELKVCQITLDELRYVVDDHRALITKVEGQIPESTAPKIRGIFFKLYKEQLDSTGSVDLEMIFASFTHPSKSLSEDYQVELIDDAWFMDSEGSPETQNLAEELKRVYKEKRGRPKGRASALHDALLLLWILKERDQTAENTWLVTLDTTLPRVLPQTNDKLIRFPAITLDALIQWISPIVAYGDTDEIAAIFSEAIKYQLLPQESFFDLKDFLMFAEMEWSCKELPADDVEECIRYIRVNAPNLDPSNPVDREKLAREISKFFADPSRKYKSELQSLEAEIAASDEAHQKEILERDKQIEELKQHQAEQEKKRQENSLRRSTWIRAILAFLLLIVLEVFALYVSGRFGSGDNIFQRIGDLWVYPVLAFGVGIAAFWIILGKKRMQLLGWSLNKILRNE